MIASDLISDVMIPLQTSNTGEEALGIMNDYYVKHLPIVNNKQLLGLLSEEDILDHDVHEAVGSYALSLGDKVYVKADDHLFEVLAMISEYKLTVVPVVQKEKEYLGLITMQDLVQNYADSFSFSEPGSIIVLVMDRKDYSLAEISKIIELESAAILSVFISSPDIESGKILVTIKVNRQEIQHIKASLLRYGYDIRASFVESEYIDTLKERYDMLMSYLNV